jgi:broad specificity phosphatase PhoE
VIGESALFVLRHGETAWSRERKHTGRSDIPLTEVGREQARLAAAALSAAGAGPTWALALASPLSRAADTARLAGVTAEPDDRLVEWDYGDYEGITTAEIRQRRDGWDLWRDGCPNGEKLTEVAARVDLLLAERVRPALLAGDVLLVAHSHLLRVLTARWLELEPAGGRHFVLDPAHIGVLGTEHDSPALLGWNLGAPA